MTSNSKEGDYVDVRRQGREIVIRPKRLVDLDDALGLEDEKLVERGFRELRHGKSVAWNELKDGLGV